MISSRFLDVSFIFYYRNIIKKTEFLNKLYFNKKCDIEHPHLRPIAITFVIGCVLEMLMIINLVMAIIFGYINKKAATYYISIGLFIVLMIVLIGSLIYCYIQNSKAEKEFDKYSQEELNLMREELEKEWPNFFY